MAGLDGYFKCIRVCFFTVNVLITLAGIAVMVLGSVGLVIENKGVPTTRFKLLFDPMNDFLPNSQNTNNFNDQYNYNSQVHHSQWGVFFWSFVIVLILGIIMAVTGFMGCFGAALENQCLMGTYAVLMVIAIALDVTGAALIAEHFDIIINSVRLEVQSTFEDLFMNYQAADRVQIFFRCCGARSYAEWPLSLDFPASCCRDGIQICNRLQAFHNSPTNQFAVDARYYPGCLARSKDIVGNIIFIAPIALGILILIEAFALACVFGLCCIFNQAGDYDSDEFSMSSGPGTPFSERKTAARLARDGDQQSTIGRGVGGGSQGIRPSRPLETAVN